MPSEDTVGVGGVIASLWGWGNGDRQAMTGDHKGPPSPFQPPSPLRTDEGGGVEKGVFMSARWGGAMLWRNGDRQAMTGDYRPLVVS